MKAHHPSKKKLVHFSHPRKAEDGDELEDDENVDDVEGVNPDDEYVEDAQEDAEEDSEEDSE